jgi:chromosome segregation ATPase
LWGVTRLDAVVGAGVDTLIATEDRDRFAAFVAQICEGESGLLEHEVVRPDGSHVRIETRAVPIRRAEGTSTMFLGSSWDISARAGSAGAFEEVHARCASLEAERDALQAALDAAKAAAGRIDTDRMAEQSRAEDSIARVEAARSEAEERHRRLADEWANERETLLARLATGDRNKADATRILTGERDDARAALEAAELEYQQALARMSEERTQLQQEARVSGEAYEAQIISLRAEQDNLSQAVQQLNTSYAALVSERTTERAEFEAALRSERSRCAELHEEREQWREDMASILSGLNETGAHAQRLLDKCRNMRLVSAKGHADPESQNEGLAATGTDAE